MVIIPVWVLSSGSQDQPWQRHFECVALCEAVLICGILFSTASTINPQTRCSHKKTKVVSQSMQFHSHDLKDWTLVRVCLHLWRKGPYSPKEGITLEERLTIPTVHGFLRRCIIDVFREPSMTYLLLTVLIRDQKAMPYHFRWSTTPVPPQRPSKHRGLKLGVQHWCQRVSMATKNASEMAPLGDVLWSCLAPGRKTNTGTQIVQIKSLTKD